MKRFFILSALALCLLPAAGAGLDEKSSTTAVQWPDSTWTDTDGAYINAHGCGILKYEGRYYWFGEHRPEQAKEGQDGVTCYSSDDLHTWKNEGLVFRVSEEPGVDIERGCVVERPKVIYNPKTKQFVLWFHLELKGQGYKAARSAVAVSDTPTGPYRYLGSGRANPGVYPENMTEEQRSRSWDINAYKEWTPQWIQAVQEGCFTLRDLEGGQMERDMTLYVDDDGKAYHIYASEENLTLQIAELSDDFTTHSGRYIRVAPTGHNEAPAIFKHDGTYWLITSGCTGWAPNEARLYSAPSIWGPWTKHPNPCRGEGSELTFGAQSTYVLQLPDGGFLFMADIWKPKNLKYSDYLWLPVQFDEDGTPYVEKP